MLLPYLSATTVIVILLGLLKIVNNWSETQDNLPLYAEVIFLVYISRGALGTTANIILMILTLFLKNVIEHILQNRSKWKVSK